LIHFLPLMMLIKAIANHLFPEPEAGFTVNKTSFQLMAPASGSPLRNQIMKQEFELQQYTGPVHAANCIRAKLDDGWRISSSAIHIDNPGAHERIEDNAHYLVFYVRDIKSNPQTNHCAGCQFYGIDSLDHCVNCNDGSLFKPRFIPKGCHNCKHHGKNNTPNHCLDCRRNDPPGRRDRWAFDKNAKQKEGK